MYAEQSQLLVELVLCAVGIGACLGFMFTGVLGQLCDLIVVVWERKWRIADARDRDHSKVPLWPDRAGDGL